MDPLGWAPSKTIDFAGSDALFPVKEGQRDIVKIQMQGTRTRDFTQVFKVAGITKAEATGYTWHHLHDFDPKTGTTTMQLVESGVHPEVNHKESAHQFVTYFREKFPKLKYDTKLAVKIAFANGWLKNIPKSLKKGFLNKKEY